MQRVQCSVISNCDSANYYEHTVILASVLKEIKRFWYITFI